MALKTDGVTDCDLLGRRLSSPLIVASGPLTDQESGIRRFCSQGVGAVVTKTIHPDPPRHLSERIAKLPTGMLNSTTYSKRGVGEWCDILGRLSSEGLPVIASIHADTPRELGELAYRVAETGCGILELGISCINESEPFDESTDRVAAYAAAVRTSVGIPFSVKLALDSRLDALIAAAVGAGASAITLSDTLPGASVNLNSGRLQLGGVFGYSGQGIKPLVLAQIFRLRKSGFQTPILGCGGVSCGEDVIEYLSAGASVVQVYTALHTKPHETANQLLAETREWLVNRRETARSMSGRSLQDNL